MNHFVVLALVIVVQALPFWRFYRTRQSGESFNAWWIRPELHLLETLGGRLQATSWLTPSLFLRSLFVVGRVTYGIFWLMALLMLFGDIVNLSWSWQKIDSPLPVLSATLETLMLLAHDARKAQP